MSTRHGKQFRLWLNKRDRERLEMIRALHEVTLSTAVRLAIRAACQRLGLEKELPDDILNKS